MTEKYDEISRSELHALIPTLRPAGDGYDGYDETSPRRTAAVQRLCGGSGVLDVASDTRLLIWLVCIWPTTSQASASLLFIDCCGHQ